VPSTLKRIWASAYLPAALAAVPFLTMAARLIVTHRAVVLAGDPAVLDLNTLDATRLNVALGPYSRFGFHHPGPALFYVMAPVMVATGRATWTLHLGVQLLYATTVVTVVAIVCARAGRAAGAAAALAVLAYLAVVHLDVLSVPWNPLTIIPVAACFLVAAAASRPGSMAVTAATGTFLVQTHVGTLAVVAVCAALGAAWFGLSLWRGARRPAGADEPAGPVRSGRASRWLPALALAGVAGLAWLPPAVEQIRNQPGNAGEIVHFFTHRHPGSGLARPAVAASIVGRQVDLLRGPVFLGEFRPGVVDRRAVGALGTFAVAAVALVAIGARRRDGFAVRLGLIAAASAAVSVYSVTRIVGDLHWYLMLWMSASVVPLLVGYGLLLSGRRLDIGPPAIALLGVLVVVLSLQSVRAPLYRSPAFPGDDQGRTDTITARALVDAAVARSRARSVYFEANDEGPSPTIQGVAVDLERRGVRTTVSANLEHIFGQAHRETGRETIRMVFQPIGTPPPPGGERIGATSRFDLYAIQPPAD